MTELKSNSESKRRVVEAELVGGDVVALSVNTTTEGLILPNFLKEEPVTLINISLSFCPKDCLALTDDGIWATLNFGGLWSTCFLPWKSIFVATGKSEVVYTWGNDIPSILSKALPKSDVPIMACERPYLRLVRRNV